MRYNTASGNINQTGEFIIPRQPGKGEGEGEGE